MYCIYCGRLGDFDEHIFCEECRIKVAKNNERVYLICLLLEVYPYISDIRLREKIESVVSPRQCRIEREPASIQTGYANVNSRREL
jgi:hypothetical protein